MKRTVFACISTLLTTAAFAGIFVGNEETAGRQQLAANSTDVVALNASRCEAKGANLPPAEQIAHMKSCLAEASSPANVQAVALQQKKAYCDKNVKNKGLKGGEKESYLAMCMNHNEAQVQYALINRGIAPTNTDTARKDYNKTLQEAPPAAGGR